MENVTETFVFVDDTLQAIAGLLHQENAPKKRGTAPRLSKSEVLTLLILFHQSSFAHFKGFYRDYARRHLRAEFPTLVCYHRFLELMPGALGELWWLLHALLGDCTDVSFIDATLLKVCRIQRSLRHRVFQGMASKGWTSMGWFFGFKLHIVINHRGELVRF